MTSDAGKTLYGEFHVFNVVMRGHFTRTFDGERCRHYWRGVRVPWLIWAMFS